MATPSQPTTTLGQPQHQGLLSPFGEASTHPGSTTLDDVHDLLHRLITAVSKLTTRVAETEEATKDVRVTVESISQQVDIIAGKVDEPRTPEQVNPIQTIDKTPQAGTTGRQRVKIKEPAPVWHSLISEDKSAPKVVTSAGNTSRIRTASIPLTPTTRLASQTPGGSTKPIKVKAPEPFKGGSGTEAKQWMARMSRWLRLSVTQFETKEDVITYLLVNMEGTALAWALPHLANIGTDKATIRTVNDFDKAFEQAFFDPDKQQAAERKITTLTQTTTAATYATEFCTLLMSLDWNNAALQAQFYKGLHWHVKQQLPQKEDQPQDLKALIAAAICIDNVCRKLKISRPPCENCPKPATTTSTSRLANTSTPCIDLDCLKANPNYVSKAKQQRRRDKKLCIKCGKAGH
ncbi:hypothetical protein RSOLAG1IB_11798 [Rhizoctonia solani AG-1 IB]|uniref:Rhizoctonia solani AG1-IB WGS project CAOJ00000000 data, isolate 7/3/14, contig 19870 n=1 Tax=Thanatephorus cucumeris (strain AG1-IB / isolate 7/3/14) TaxID=1108050 RepID=M5C4R8_THACB|nr:Retrotransposon-derived protein PEG10 AltName: Full=Embryonal carcinoma differentiation regulated protein [Rhizoctonia solani AG-1 IB]CEL54853.1 hypothetical protein RSOLAG1IB_11798 [Rhizoctonia solani AG-1 IB]